MAMMVGQPWATCFGEFEFWGGKYIALKGKATISLKNLVPLHKEKQCSAELLQH
jgi:hypothetical protein